MYTPTENKARKKNKIKLINNSFDGRGPRTLSRKALHLTKHEDQTTHTDCTLYAHRFTELHSMPDLTWTASHRYTQKLKVSTVTLKRVTVYS